MNALSHHPVGRILASRRLAPYAVLEECLDAARRVDGAFEQVVIERGVLSRRQLLEILENEYFCPAVDVLAVEPTVEAVNALPREVAVRHRACPLKVADDVLHVALADPSDVRVVQSIKVSSHLEIAPHVGLGADIEASIEAAYSHLHAAIAALEPSGEEIAAANEPAPDPFLVGGSTLEVDAGFSLQAALDAAPTPKELVEILIRTARSHGATDLHLQPQVEGLWCRARLDGLLRNLAVLASDRAASLVSFVKILAGMDIAEHRRAQDGRTTYESDGVALDLRVSCVRSQFGEKIVLRLLERQAELLDLRNLEMPPAVQAGFGDVLTSPLGLYLVTGPTGSGKTTTLYATLQSLQRGSLNISTLEDPIEYSLPGITQMQVNEEIGAGFAEGLRALLRQDPDVILVGEIRDRETAEIACRAALTGHKVMSTIHTNDAVQAVTRLLDMGVPAHLISSTLRGVLAQRLLRRICDSCREPVALTEVERALLGHPADDHVYRGAGCDACGHTGYKGRFGVFEYFALGTTTHRLVQENASAFAIRYAAQKEGMLLLSDFARRAVLDGTTTVAEIQRVILADEHQEQLCHGCERVVDIEFTVCPYCQTTLKDTCPSCQRPVEASWEACAHCGEVLVREWQKQYCRSCLAPVRPEWDSCMYCDAELTP